MEPTTSILYSIFQEQLQLSLALRLSLQSSIKGTTIQIWLYFWKTLEPTPTLLIASSHPTYQILQCNNLINTQPRVANATLMNSSIILPSNVSTILAEQKCSKNSSFYTKDNYWGTIQVRVNLNQSEYYVIVSYQFTCDTSFRYNHFDMSLFILVVLSSICVTLLARFGKIYSVKYLVQKDRFTTAFFQGFSLNIWFLFSYVILYLLLSLTTSFFPDGMRIPTIIIVSILSFCCSGFIFCEVLAVLPLQWGFKKRVFSLVRRCDILSVIFGAVVVFLYFFFNKTWIMNDMIALCIMGVSTKIFKIKSMKNACLLLLPCALLDATTAIISHFIETESYDVLVLKRFNYPLVLELPLFEVLYDKRCSWVSIMNIILPGLVIGYNLRVDKSKNTAVYTLMSFVGLLGGCTIWVIVQASNKHSWPQSLFTYVIMIIMSIIWAHKRGELSTVWNGTFYDIFLMDPFIVKSRTISQVSDTHKYENDGPTVEQLIRRNREISDPNESRFIISHKLFEGLHKEKSEYHIQGEQTIIDDVSKEEEGKNQ